MKIFLVAVAVVLAVTGLQATPAPVEVVPVLEQPYGDGAETQIVGGAEAAKGQFPYMAAIVLDNYAFCGGALISKNWVLTAGHCIATFSSWVVSLGVHNLRDTTDPSRVNLNTREAIRHEGYDRKTIANDVGVIKLPEDVKLNDRVNLLALPPRSFATKNWVGSQVRVSGWGKVRDSANSISPTLQFVDLEIISEEECKKVYGSIINNKKYCCSGVDKKNNKKSTCNGDSGGSLTTGTGKNLTHLGIISFAAADGCSLGYPSGYTATPHHVDWISSKTGIKIQDE